MRNKAHSLAESYRSLTDIRLKNHHLLVCTHNEKLIFVSNNVGGMHKNH
jgi:hypothetical protein